MWKANRSTGHKSGTKKKSDSQKEIEPIPFRAPGRRSIHLATRTYGEQGHLTGLIHHKKNETNALFNEKYLQNSLKTHKFS